MVDNERFDFISVYNYSVMSGFPTFILGRSVRNLALVKHLVKVNVLCSYLVQGNRIMVWLRHVNGKPMFKRAKYIRPHTRLRSLYNGVIVCTTDNGLTFSERGVPYIIFLDG